MITYAGIGSRETPADVLQLMYDLAIIYAINGYILKTGAALGADQAFANGANRGNGIIQLHIPWQKYEQAWRNTLNLQNVSTHVLKNEDIEAYNSVDKFHPTPNKLSQGMKKLHARNYNIIANTNFVICYTHNGTLSGGTGQGLRLAQDLKIATINLGDDLTKQKYQNFANNNTLINYYKNK